MNKECPTPIGEAHFTWTLPTVSWNGMKELGKDPVRWSLGVDGLESKAV